MGASSCATLYHGRHVKHRPHVSRHYPSQRIESSVPIYSDWQEWEPVYAANPTPTPKPKHKKSVF